MNAKKTWNRNDVLHTYRQSNDFYTFSNDVSNWKSVLCVHSKTKEISPEKIECHLRKYLSNPISIIDQYYQRNNYLDKQTFENILRNSNVLVNNTCLETLWNSCQPSDKGISSEIFRQRFTSFRRENKSNSHGDILSSNQSQIISYTTCLRQAVKKYWQNLKKDFSSLDRYGRLFITIDQAVNLMKTYCFPLNDQQRDELALLFSPKNNGQFHYFDFMQCFTNQLTLENHYPDICFRSTYAIQSKQSWKDLSITIDCILHRIRSECVRKYGSIHRMFHKYDQNHQGYLTKIQFNQLLQQFDVHLDKEELYHLISEIDQNQDGLISYEELYYSLITDALQI